MMKKNALLILPTIMFAGLAFAGPKVQITTTDSNTSTFINKDCKATDSCDLKSFNVKIDQYKVVIDGNETEAARGTRMVADYQTKDAASMEKYGIGQFIQGCQFVSTKVNGVVTYYPVINREFMGETVPYFHPKMVVDGFIQDPLAWGEDASTPRHSNYITKNPVPDFTGKDYYKGKAPADNRLYVIDRPGVAGFYEDSQRAYNISLKFRTCIYKSAEVPKDNAYDSLDFAKPLNCVEWTSSYVYNFDKKAFESTAEPIPYCSMGAITYVKQ